MNGRGQIYRPGHCGRNVHTAGATQVNDVSERGQIYRHWHCGRNVHTAGATQVTT